MSDNALTVKILGDPSSVKKAFGEVEQAGGKLHGFLSGVFKVGLAGAATGLAGLGVAAKIGWDEFTQGTKVAAQTNAVIKSTGDVSHVSAKEVADLGTSLMKKSGIDDEVIKSGENMLLTFTNIRNEVGKGNDIFSQSTKTLTDMTVALGSDPQKQAIQLGKALNDPIHGLSALARVGVTFTDGQKATVKAMVESGNTMGAQKLILHELNKEFGGSAEAAGKTLPGQLSILKQEFNNFAGDMVAKVVPALTGFVSLARDYMPQVKAVITDTFSVIGTKAQEVWPVIQQTLLTLWIFFRDNLLPILKQLGEIFVTAVGNIATVVQEHMPQIRRILETVGDVIKGIAKVAVPLLKFAFEDVLPTAIGIAITAIDLIVSTLRGIGTGIKNVVGWFKDLPGNIADAITGGIGLVKNAITGLFGKVIGWVKDVLGIKSPSSVFYDIGVSMIQGFIGGVGSMAGKLKGAVEHMVGGFIGKIGGALVGGPQSDLDKQLWPQSGGGGNLVDLGHRLQGMGFQVSEHPAFGGVHPVHAQNSYHYKGRAIDVNWPGGGPVELSHLRSVFGMISSLHPVEEMIEDAGSQNQHLHVAMAEGGIVTRPTRALIGESGPEAVIPLGRAGLGDLHVHIHAGTVIGGNAEQLVRDLERPLIEALIRHQLNGGQLVVR